MQIEQIAETETIEAGGYLSKNTLIGYDLDVCQAGAPALGVCMDNVAMGKLFPLSRGPAVKVLVGVGGVSAGDPVVSDASGHVVKASALSATIPAGGVAMASDQAQPDLVLTGSILGETIIGYARESKLENALCLVRII